MIEPPPPSDTLAGVGSRRSSSRPAPLPNSAVPRVLTVRAGFQVRVAAVVESHPPPAGDSHRPALHIAMRPLPRVCRYAAELKPDRPAADFPCTRQPVPLRVVHRRHGDRCAGGRAEAYTACHGMAMACTEVPLADSVGRDSPAGGGCRLCRGEGAEKVHKASTVEERMLPEASHAMLLFATAWFLERPAAIIAPDTV